ncbi:hypothetical protein F4779DRAFT_640389 [Xylariaceae sp. FL0662B]|nr:hypothetical protein F4779DRAFT_640389 [Xylariaceae sp. FL0662B]
MALDNLSKPFQGMTLEATPHTTDVWEPELGDTSFAGVMNRKALAYDGHRPYGGPDNTSPLYVRLEDFPRTALQEFRHGGSKQPDLLTGENADDPEQKTENAWAQKKTLFTETYHAVPPPPELLRDVKFPSPSARPDGKRILDPYHPDFNVGLFTDPILEVFKCPHKTCKYKAKTGRQLVTHLKGEKHSGVQVKCPNCSHIFTSASGWVRHSETVSLAKCNVRRMANYRLALHQITGGALDIDPVNKLANGTTKYLIDEHFLKSLRGPKTDRLKALENKENKIQEETKKTQEAAKKQQGAWKYDESHWGT